jgi:3-hydroxyacyl-CoA dehydrogenase
MEANVSVVEIEREGAIAVVRLNHPPVNALGQAVRTALQDSIAVLSSDHSVRAIIITGTGRAFSAGADIAEFASPAKKPLLPEVINAIEASEKPVVAAINGLALGGGLELVLGCHYRIAARGVRQLGLPEVKLGIVPGAGGTQRLPRLIGVEKALQMIVSGAPIDAEEAHVVGLVDRLVDADVTAAAISYANELLQAANGPRRVSERNVDAVMPAAEIFAKTRAGLKRHPSGPMAAKLCVDAVELSLSAMPVFSAMEKERELYREAAQTPYAKALQYAFFAQRQAASIPGLGPDVPRRDIKSIGIVGAGTMGAGITLAFLNAGYPVTIVETVRDALNQGVSRVFETLESSVKRRRLTSEQAQAQRDALVPSLELASLANVDLVIEAVFESMTIKQEVFGKLDQIVKPGAILASNTSTLNIDAIAAATQRPQDVLGLHFFSPANIMRLLEIVRGARTAQDVLATAIALSKRIGKVGVVSGVCFGFIGNRMLEEYLEETQAMLLEGATPIEIDGALESWGMAMGPLAVMDLAGIDVGWRIRKEHPISPERCKLYRVTDAIAEQGRFGQKTGAGYYKYTGDRKRELDPAIIDMFRAEAARQGIVRRKDIVADEIVERCLLRLINSGARVLDEGIAIRASDIDTVYLNGYGFPAWRGGPMWQADIMGLSNVAERINAYAAKHGARWTIAPLIERLASENGSFASIDQAKV